MMTGLSSDYMSRLLIGVIGIFFSWAQAHGPFRDRIPRYAFPLVALFCVLWLIHLPRLPGVVVREDREPPAKVVMHFRSEWSDRADVQEAPHPAGF